MRLRDRESGGEERGLVKRTGRGASHGRGSMHGRGGGRGRDKGDNGRKRKNDREVGGNGERYSEG